MWTRKYKDFEIARVPDVSGGWVLWLVRDSEV